MLRPYISHFISEMELRILSIAGSLIKVSITDVRSLLHYICILSFFRAAIFKQSKMTGGPQ